MANESTQESTNGLPAQSDSGTSSRRGFFRKLMFGGAASTAVVGTVKVADSMVPEVDLQGAYAKDVAPGDQIIAEREHVLMSAQEKEDMVQMFLDNYELSRSRN